MLKVHLKNIRAEILSELKSTQKSIWVAVYWFTNQELFNTLKLKRKQEVSVKLIIHNDYINIREAGLPFQELIDCGCEFYFSDDDYPMHNKFCIIDGQVLINGSYNWTYSAESKNRENVLIIEAEKDVMEAFDTEFSVLIELVKPLQSINRLTRFEVEENNLLRNRDY